MKYAITMFENQYSVEPHTEYYSWQEIVTAFSSLKPFEGDKTKAPHFNGVEFKSGGKRNYAGVESVHVLVLDYDDGMSLKEAQQFFNDYRHVGYTSYNHQFDKHGDGKLVDKFRILLPLVKPCPFETWLEIKHSVKEFAPGVDSASERPSQPFAVPIVRPGHDGEVWTNDGKAVDWTTWKREKRDGGFTSANPRLRSEHKLHPDDVLQTKKGNIRVGDVTKHIGGVYCPFHGDKSPGEFVNKSAKGYIFLHCHKCGTIYMEEDEPSFIDSFLEERRNKREQEQTEKPSKEEQHEQIKEAIGLVEIDEAAEEAFGRDRRAAMLKKHCMNDRSQILYAFEGFGKSYLAVLRARAGKKIVFACYSNKQAREQYESFKENAKDLKVQLIISREEKMKVRYGIECELTDPKHPWDSGMADKSKTKKEILLKTRTTLEDFEEIWEECSPDDPDFTHDIIVTTHARVHVWGDIQAKKLGEDFGKYKSHYVDDLQRLTIPKETVIFFDDCDAKNFERLTDFSNEWAEAKIDGRPIEVADVGKRRYFVKPGKFFFGYGLFFCQLIFSTTELYTRHLIKKQYPDLDEPPLMPLRKMWAGDITVISTKLVRSKTDGIFPCIIQRMKKESFDVHYFADGQGNAFNLVNNRGQNIFKENDIVVEISQPPSSQAIRMCDELGLDAAESGNFVKVVYCMDRAHQAIGRNSGYRWVDENIDSRREAIVVMDPQIAKQFARHTRYLITKYIDGDEVIGGSRKLPRDTVRDCLLWYVRNYKHYMTNGKEFLYDAKSALSELTFKTLREKRRARIIEAVSNVQKSLVRPEDVAKLDVVVRELVN